MSIATSTPRNANAAPRGGAASRRSPASRRSGAGGTLLGLFIGLVLGLGLAAGVAYYLMKSGGAYPSATAAKEALRDPARDSTRAAKAEPVPAEKPRFDFYKILPGVEEPKIQAKPTERVAPDKATLERAVSPDKAAAKTDDRAAAKDRARTPETSAGAEKIAATEKLAATDKGTAAEKEVAARQRFWLQAGSFAAEADAENLKARLALAGWEAAIQQASVPDKGVRYRVRLGPYDNTDELNRVKSELGKRGFDAAVIKH
jgi:cell division protein FtsN